MSDVEEKRWKNELMGISLWSVKIDGEFYFFGREVAETLRYVDPRKTIQDRVDPEEKKTIEELLGKKYKIILEQSLNSTEDKISSVEFFQRLRRNQKLFTEFALYRFCGESKKEKAKPFQRWIFDTIKTIRKTGAYNLPGGAVENPLDLIAKVSNLEKKIQSLKKETKTCDKGTQTPKYNKIIKNYLKELKSEFKKPLKEIEISSDSGSFSSSSPRQSSSDSE